MYTTITIIFSLRHVHKQEYGSTLIPFIKV